MKSYGTHVVGGTSPGKKGSDVHGVPVYNTVKEIAREHGEIDFSVIFVPGHVLKTAVMEAADAGVKNVIPCVEGTPIHDIMEMIAYCKAKGTRLLGPGSIGIITPGEAVVGWLGGQCGMGQYLLQKRIHRRVLAQRRPVGNHPVGAPRRRLRREHGHPYRHGTGSRHLDGGSASAVRGRSRNRRRGGLCRNRWFAGRGVRRGHRLGKFTKPFVVYVSGAWAPEGPALLHASNIVERGRGSAKSKMDAITKAGGYVAMTPTDIPVILHEKLKK